MTKILQIEHASVKVMRSHDYCHFEVTLSSSDLQTATAVDDLRKEAARLADKAVEQYKTAKEVHAKRDEISKQWNYKRAFAIPIENRDWHDKAVIKYHEDAAFQSKFHYDYQDDWDQPGFDD